MLAKLSALLCGLVFIATSTQAQRRTANSNPSEIPTAQDPSDVLRGLTGFDVQLSMSTSTSLIDTVALRNRVELKLRQNGIGVGADEPPFLRVNCVALERDSSPIIAYSCDVLVRQIVFRSFPSLLRTFATVWNSTGHVSTVGSSKFADSLFQQVDSSLDEFLNAWYKANPKRP
jgi:hypothetical protein